MDWMVTQVSVGDQKRDSGNSLGEAGCWVMWNGKKWADSAYLGGERSDVRSEGEGDGRMTSRWSDTSRFAQLDG